MLSRATEQGKAIPTLLKHTHLHLPGQILYARAYTHEAQLDLLAGVAAKMVDEPFKLLIVDSIMANFRCVHARRYFTPLFGQNRQHRCHMASAVTPHECTRAYAAPQRMQPGPTSLGAAS